jgi:hypothetical protein
VNGPGIEPFSALRVGRHKLIYFYGRRQFELYDLSADLGERANLMDTQRPLARRLAAQLRAALREAGAQMPIDAATKRPVEVPEL